MIKVMLSPENFLKQSWSYLSTIDSPLEEVEFHGLDIDYEMANTEMSSIFQQDICHDKLLNCHDRVEVCLNPPSTENQLFDEVEDYFDWMEYEGNSSSPPHSVDGTSTFMVTTESISFDSSKNNLLVIPKEDMEIDDQLSISHLLKALGDAKENKLDDLADIVSRKLQEKACPKGSVLHRLAYYMVQSSNSHLDQYYLAQEAIKNYDVAFSLFYQIFPYGRLAHFVANSSVLEGIPEDVKMIHIVDFDMGEGVQWPPLIEAISKKHPNVAVQLISVKRDNYDYVSPLQSLGHAKNWLCEYAKVYSPGLDIKVTEMGVKELSTEMKLIGSSRGNKNWVAFNYMRDLPHMQKQTSSSHAAAFLKVAQEYLGRYNSKSGILTVGRGSNICWEKADFPGSGSIFEVEMGRTAALLESMELQMPLHLSEARVAMECLFVAPYLSSLNKFNTRESKGGVVVPNIRLGAQKISEGVIAEATELVREGNGLYYINTEGENELVLSYKGTTLLWVSSWGT